jgi:hypothetical protein
MVRFTSPPEEAWNATLQLGSPATSSLTPEAVARLYRRSTARSCFKFASFARRNVVKRTPGFKGYDWRARCHGFYGASSMERLPTEIALTEQTRRFKSVQF